MIQGCFEPAPDRSSHNARLAFGALLARAAAPPERQDPFASYRHGVGLFDPRAQRGAQAKGLITRADAGQADRSPRRSSPRQVRSEGTPTRKAIVMLRSDDIFPSLTLARAGGGEVHLPGDLPGGFGVILFYRGAWSDVCVDQLEAFSRAAGEFAREGITVVSVSVDNQEAAEALVEQHKLAFPVAYAADARAVSAVTGVPINEDAVSFEATGFVINPEGRIDTAVYSTFEAGEDRIVTAIDSIGAIGRLMPDEVLRLVRKARGSEQARSGGEAPPGAPPGDASRTGAGL